MYTCVHAHKVPAHIYTNKKCVDKSCSKTIYSNGIFTDTKHRHKAQEFKKTKTAYGKKVQ